MGRLTREDIDRAVQVMLADMRNKTLEEAALDCEKHVKELKREEEDDRSLDTGWQQIILNEQAARLSPRTRITNQTVRERDLAEARAKLAESESEAKAAKWEVAFREELMWREQAESALSTATARIVELEKEVARLTTLNIQLMRESAVENLTDADRRYLEQEHDGPEEENEPDAEESVE